MEKDLNELVQKLKAAAGANLKGVVLYGSAAAGEFQPKHSDLNVLCLLERLDAAELEKLNPAAGWWAGKGHPAPLVFTPEELRRSADVFAIEMLEIKASRRVLFGEDDFAQLEVPMSLHRVQVERELRTNLVRLRQGLLTAPKKRSALLGLLTGSVSSFTTLFRHALLALGESPPQGKRAVVNRLAALASFDPAAFHTVLDVREGKRSESEVEMGATVRGYLEGVARVADEVDRRLAARS